jgi:tripartite-type tricarboxylate transporter receptor subunit TctC
MKFFQFTGMDRLPSIACHSKPFPKETNHEPTTAAGLRAARPLRPAPATAQGNDWPTRPIKILVGSAPGGGTDAMARAVADRLGSALKVPVVVDNRPGASNTLAADVTAKSTDGHTMVMGVSTAHAIAPHLLKLNYDNNKDLVPVAFVGSVPNVLVVSNSLGVNSVAELVALAKKSPGKLNFATSGSGSTQHIAAELFKEATGTFLTHIPYKGSGPALLDLMSGQVQMSFDTLASVLPHIQAGKVKALAVASAKRNPQPARRADDGRSRREGRGDGRLVRHLHAGGHAQGGAGARARGSEQGAGPARDPHAPGRHRRRDHADDAGPVHRLPQRREQALRELIQRRDIRME